MMEVEAAVCDEEQALLPPRSRVGAHGKWVSPLLCASFLVAAGIGGGSMWRSGENRSWTSGVMGLSTTACTANGQYCGTSKCCSKEGSICFKKNEKWASCNASCTPKKSWEGSHGHGRWVETQHPVWDCTVLSGAGVEIH